MAQRTWMWTMTGAVVAPAFPNHGFAESRDEAKAAFAATWRAWMTSTRRADRIRRRR